MFPVGNLYKKEVRKIAQEQGFDKIYNKKSSLGICFIGKRNFTSFIDQYLPQSKGSIIDLETNKVIAEHTGIYHYTVGQRIVLDDKYYKNKTPFYVTKKILVTNSIYVVSEWIERK
jgi:tRNA U34 2-thiouridine synthase MnmA/TrmU